uniref:NADH-ubiquinone oxidoreductase chain 2 n=1 Tax=Ramulus hainanense TaxID=556494 RepID=C7SDP0_9NEOP|nr:NADH dehydrogenase subunit 2 [Ramulus hainanense]ACH78281.1 NADH dehydrogenase subunit 2 [Ramulus hainanense]
MINKSNNLLFSLMLVTSVLMAVSSNSWFMVWMGMEINIMSFMPMIISQKNINSKEASLTYFITQTIASMIMMMAIVMMMIDAKNINFNPSKTGEYMMMTALMMKSGISPFHFWMPKMMEGMNWWSCMILMTWQKITPMIMMSTLMKMNTITITAMILSIIVGAIGGLNQTSLRKLMAYSSISNNGWMMMAIMISENMWMIYFMFYSLMIMTFTMTMNQYKIYHMNQLVSMNENMIMKFIMSMNMLSIGGLPPMAGFLPKWMVIQYSSSMLQLMMVSTMTLLTLITVYYYLRIMFSAVILSYIEPKWNTNKKSTKQYNMMMITLSIMGLTAITMIMSMY